VCVGEVQARLICVGKYRVYSIKKAKIVGKHSIAREGHMFDINLIESASADEIIIHFERDSVFIAVLLLLTRDKHANLCALVDRIVKSL
jgi:hypothetical protein